ncbi:MAG: adenosylcobinamide amidohydrolase [Acidimicrobiia bacterium]|nr:adenosylcobinamide amidohydrolase [Acidimicrobiia bacterium]MYE67101.1 adenosylcobinamide amidohydrolase [Acidimicrobiia bacterium]MYJ14834.1 adenosylcobinamide amidohydrolase [Acidimicrobiia bacterium]
MAVEPVLRVVAAAPRGALIWRWPLAVEALSSAAVGGGRSRLDWVVNVGVDSGYGRTDLADHAAEVASGLGLAGQGVALFTAAAVDRCTRSAADGVTVHATVGVSHPTWASPAGPTSAGGAEAGSGSPQMGTINLVIQVPVALEAGAGVNAVITATEAKTQALVEAGVDGTGTATDAVVVVWPSGATPERFAGPRSPWGSRIARCAHDAVRSGLAP